MSAARDTLRGSWHARLTCGCRLDFRPGVERSPVTVVVEEKAAGCPHAIHVRSLPVYDFREALRPATRPIHAEETELGEEG